MIKMNGWEMSTLGIGEGQSICFQDLHFISMYVDRVNHFEHEGEIFKTSVFVGINSPIYGTSNSSNNQKYVRHLLVDSYHHQAASVVNDPSQYWGVYFLVNCFEEGLELSAFIRNDLNYFFK